MSALSQRLRAVMGLDPAAPAVEFEGRWHTWGELATATGRLDAVLRDTGLGAGSPVGIMLCNRPSPLAMLVGLLCAEACVVTVNPMLGRERVRADVAALDLPMLVGERDDLALLDDGARGSTALVAVGGLAETLDVTPPADARASERGARHTVPGVAVRMLTSGTTGPPKRVDLTYETLEHVMEGAKHYETASRSDLGLREGVVVLTAPLVHVSGLFRLVQALLDGRKVALLERFTVDGFLDALRRHRPKTVSLVPTALRMVLEAGADPGDLASVRSVVSGTAPLDPEVAEAFTQRFGVPVLTSYGATEFGGGVAGWNLADYRAFAAVKRGSVGRPHPGCELRVVDPDLGTELGPGATGLLEVRGEQLGTDRWVRTTDLARLDADGFLWIVGRADQTIVRGGHKVQPEVVQAAFTRHPGVQDAAVVGLPDARLGAVPVAAVQRRPGYELDEGALLAEARRRLAPYEVPVALAVLDVLPRTESGKPDLAAVRDLFARVPTSGGR